MLALTLMSSDLLASEKKLDWSTEALVTDPYQAGGMMQATSAERVGVPTAQDLVLTYDAQARFQEIEGFGAAITDSSLLAISSLPQEKQGQLLRQLFHPRQGLNISYLRVPIGASDFGVESYTYADTPDGREDPQLKHFSFRRARNTVAFLRRVKWINPNLRIMLSPWSPPAWMKTSGHLNGGSLKPEHFSTFARYLVKSVQRFERAGLTVDALTIQNEPFHSTEKYPSMGMSTDEQIIFIRDHLHPQLRRAGLKTKILALDHNYDLRSEADAMHAALGDRIAGIAYHCYGGTFDLMKGSHAPLYQTECSGGTWGDGPGSLNFWLQSQVIGAGHLGNRLSIAWNLALDQNHGPFQGYCDNCRGLVDIDTVTKKVTYNPELFALAHGGKYLKPGARRIATSRPGDESYSTIGYVNRDGSVALVMENRALTPRFFVVATPRGDFFRVSVPAGGAATINIQ